MRKTKIHLLYTTLDGVRYAHCGQREPDAMHISFHVDVQDVTCLSCLRNRNSCDSWKRYNKLKGYPGYAVSQPEGSTCQT